MLVWHAMRWQAFHGVARSRRHVECVPRCLSATHLPWPAPQNPEPCTLKPEVTPILNSELWTLNVVHSPSPARGALKFSFPSR